MFGCGQNPLVDNPTSRTRSHEQRRGRYRERRVAVGTRGPVRSDFSRRTRSPVRSVATFLRSYIHCSSFRPTVRGRPEKSDRLQHKGCSPSRLIFFNVCPRANLPKNLYRERLTLQGLQLRTANTVRTIIIGISTVTYFIFFFTF